MEHNYVALPRKKSSTELKVFVWGKYNYDVEMWEEDWFVHCAIVARTEQEAVSLAQREYPREDFWQRVPDRVYDYSAIVYHNDYM